jgi:putative component of toxin-antitoxin plasmid stabilization module
MIEVKTLKYFDRWLKKIKDGILKSKVLSILDDIRIKGYFHTTTPLTGVQDL